MRVGTPQDIVISVRNINDSYGPPRGGSEPLHEGDAFVVTLDCVDQVVAIRGLEDTLNGSFSVVPDNPATPYPGGAVRITYHGADGAGLVRAMREPQELTASVRRSPAGPTTCRS